MIIFLRLAGLGQAGFEGVFLEWEIQFKSGVHVKAVLTTFNTALLPISRSRYKQREISLLISLTTVWWFCVNFWVVWGHFGKEIFFLKG